MGHFCVSLNQQGYFVSTALFCVLATDGRIRLLFWYPMASSLVMFLFFVNDIGFLMLFTGFLVWLWFVGSPVGMLFSIVLLRMNSDTFYCL
jgi:hypothetical protein